jgi:hypothetical protein
MGWLITTEHDSKGRSLSAYFVTTPSSKLVKECFSSKMDAQVRQLESMFTITEMDQQGVEAELANLVLACGRGDKEQLKDWHRRVLGLLFKFDIRRWKQ